MYKTPSKNLFPNSVRIGLVNPNVAQTWTQRTLPDGTIVGEVKKGDTINHTTSQPIANGLFCQRIFGPCVDYTCACGQTKIPTHSNIHVSSDVCPDCLVEWTESSVRRNRLGFIQLISPVTHKWFADSGSAYIPALMGTTVKTFRGIRDCKLFFPFSLQNLEKQHPIHNFSYKASVRKAKSKSGDLLLRYSLCNRDLESNKKDSIRSNSFDTIVGLRNYATVDSVPSLALPSALPSALPCALPSAQGKALGKAQGKALSKALVAKQKAQGLRSKSKALLLAIAAPIAVLAHASGEQSKQEAKGKHTAKVAKEKPLLQEESVGSNWRAMQKIVTASYGRYINQQVKIRQNIETLAFNLSQIQNPISERGEVQNELQYNCFTISFNGYHSFPVRPSFAQSEDYRRKFVKFFGNTGAISFALQEVNKITSKNKKFCISSASKILLLAQQKKKIKKATAVSCAKQAIAVSSANLVPVPKARARARARARASAVLAAFTEVGKQRQHLQKQGKKKKHQQLRDIPIVRYTQQCTSSLQIDKLNKPNSTVGLDRPFLGFTKKKPGGGATSQLLALPLMLHTLLAVLAMRASFSSFASCLACSAFAMQVLPIPKVRHKQAQQLRTEGKSKKEAKGKDRMQSKHGKKVTPRTKQVYNCIIRNQEFPVKSYFSEINSAAKEQTIKRILAQTGGGGLQKYLGSVDLGYLVALLKNDLDEITPHLNRYKYAKSILRNALNKTSSDLSQTCNLLERLRTNYWSTVEHLTGDIPTGPELFDKIARLERNYEYGKQEYKAAKKFYKILQKRKTAHKRRYKLVSQLWRTMSNPVGLTMSSVPVLPPGLRPIIDVPKVGPIASDLNVRYRKLVFALRNLRDLSYIDFRITGAAQSSVQEAVDDILYTGGKRKTVIKTQAGKNPSVYKSLAMGLKGKHGRFRGNLLGKRVDYSGRSVIVVGPTLKIHQCGLPFSLAIKLFHPFLVRRLIQKGFCKTVYAAKKALGNSRFSTQLWALCREEMLEHLVVLNRAPTLHRLGVQAFMPVLIAGRAILLHPLVCTAFNADFDGDQMAVHIPLFPQAKAEAWKMMWSRNNFLAPSSGDPIFLPSQDMVLGCYYVTESVLEPLKDVCFTFSKAGVSQANGGVVLANSAEQVKQSKTKQEKSTVANCSKLLLQSENFTLVETGLTVLQKKTAEILSVRAALDGYTKGIYNLHSRVWVSPNGAIHSAYKPAKDVCRTQENLQTPWKFLIPNGLEGDKSSTPTLELRVSPYGITRLFQTTGSKKRNFYSAILLPANQATKKSSFEIASIRTTIGRLLFNDILQKFEITALVKK